jgi:regulator of protease activity HflC (stomatin/prohibitin superfamily)
MSFQVLLGLGCAALFVLVIVGTRMLYTFQVGIVYRGDRVRRVLQPGVRFVVPILDRVRIIELRTRVTRIDVPDCRSRDGRDLEVLATVFFRVADPLRAVEHYPFPSPPVEELAPPLVREALRGVRGDELEEGRVEAGARVTERLTRQLEPQGYLAVKVDLEIPAAESGP